MIAFGQFFAAVEKLEAENKIRTDYALSMSSREDGNWAEGYAEALKDMCKEMGKVM